MSWTRRAMLLSVLVLGPLTQASCSTAVRSDVPQGPTWRDVSGVERSPLNTRDHAATVLLFISPDCPISNGYAPEVRRIETTYRPRRVAFYLVHADPRVSAQAARKHASEYGYDFPVLMDPEQTLAHHVGATATPQAAVLDRAGNVVYLGRIDDRYVGFGRRRETATSHELRDALDAVTEGRAVAKATAPTIGCEIPPPLARNDANTRGD